MKSLFGFLLATALAVIVVSGFMQNPPNTSTADSSNPENVVDAMAGEESPIEQGRLNPNVATSADSDPAVRDVLDEEKARANLGLNSGGASASRQPELAPKRRSEHQRSLEDVIALSRQNAEILERIERLSGH